MLTIVAEDRIAGLIQYGEELADRKYRHDEPIDIFVDPALHGRGIGTAAIRQLARHLIQDRGHHRITIDPAAHNHQALPPYQQTVVPRAGGLHVAPYWRLMTPTGACKAGLLVGADRLVVMGGIDRDPVVPAVLDQVAGELPDRRGADPAAVQRGVDEDVDVLGAGGTCGSSSSPYWIRPAIRSSATIVSIVASESSHGAPSSHQRATAGVSMMRVSSGTSAACSGRSVTSGRAPATCRLAGA